MNTELVQQIREDLLSMQDVEYKEFHSKLMPTVEPERVIGIRIPVLRKYAKKLSKEGEVTPFLQELPHYYYEENNLHAFLLEQYKDFAKCVEEVNRFLPFVDNWATCDSLKPKIFGKHPEELLPWIRQWLQSDDTYVIRYGVDMLMTFYLDDNFKEEHLEWVCEVASEEYYVKMVVAWYFATALAKQYETTLPYIEGRRLEPWTHNKAIQKARESYRITGEQKEYLKSLKEKAKNA